MEKRRRARINQSLNELKNLILEAMKKDVSKFETCHKANSELTQASCKKKTDDNIWSVCCSQSFTLVLFKGRKVVFSYYFIYAMKTKQVVNT